MTDKRERKWHMADRMSFDRKRADRLFCVTLFFAALVLFLTVGSREPVLFDDSGVYLRVKPSDGVMPLYPLFILLNQYVLGNVVYLQAVVVEQALLAAFCLVFFVETFRKQFDLKIWEGCVIFCFLLYPYTIEMPTVMMTQAILTEGVSYSLFYLAVILFMKAIWKKSYGFLAGAAGMVFVLALVRSQLQILFGVCGILFLYIVCMRGKQGDKKSLLFRILSGSVGCLIISLIGVLLISRIGGSYQDALNQEGRLFYFAMSVQDPEDYLDEMRQLAAKQESSDQSVSNSQEPAKEEELIQEENSIREEDLIYRHFSMSQYVSLIFSRGMYEADPEDVSLFEDEVVQGLFLSLYETADAEGQLYSHAKKGLWMWQDIVGGIGMIGKTCFMTPSEYYAAYHPEVILSEDFSNIRSTHLQIIGITLIKAHLGRFLYHTFMLLPQAFISTVFFQMAPIYLLCHFVTLFLYLSAFVLMIWAYADRKVDNRYAEFMAFVLGSNVVLVFIISVVFFGQQRYLVYNFGIFYTAYCLLLQQLWRSRIKEVVVRRSRQKQKMSDDREKDKTGESQISE